MLENEKQSIHDIIKMNCLLGWYIPEFHGWIHRYYELNY